MGNLLSGDVDRLIFLGKVKTPRRFVENPLSGQTSLAPVSREGRYAR